MAKSTRIEQASLIVEPGTPEQKAFWVVPAYLAPAKSIEAKAKAKFPGKSLAWLFHVSGSLEAVPA